MRRCLTRRSLVSHASAMAALAAAGLRLPPEAAALATPTPGAVESPLTGRVWALQAIETDAATTSNPDPWRFTVEFGWDGALAVRFDCNAGGGDWSADGDRLEIGPLRSTLMGCADPTPIDGTFGVLLEEADTWAIEDGTLRLAGPNGTLVLVPHPLTGIVWGWTGFLGGDGETVAPDDPQRYTVEFRDDGSLDVLADCNAGFGEWSGNPATGEIDISDIATSMMLCDPGSLAAPFIRYLEEATSALIQDGGLHFALPYDSGVSSFVPLRSSELADSAGDATPAP